MSAQDLLSTYLDGWRTGNAQQSLSATTPEFYYDDPNTGRIQRKDFINFVEDFKTGVAEINGGKIGTPFLTYTDLLISEAQSLAWCWWRATDTDFQGAAVIRFSESGVVSERIAYFSELP